jgi:hypothetical protein
MSGGSLFQININDVSEDGQTKVMYWRATLVPSDPFQREEEDQGSRSS